MSDDKDNTPIEKSDMENNGSNNPIDKLIEKPAEKPAKQDNRAPAELFNAKPIPKMHSKKSSKNRLIPATIILLLLLALTFTSWNTYQQQQFQTSWNQLQNQLKQQLAQQTQSIQQIKITGERSAQVINQTQLQLNKLKDTNRNIRESLTSTQERIKSLSGRQKQDWMLAEAAYLIKVAQFQLSLQKDKATAIQLLKNADSLILKMTDSTLRPVREAIAEDISNLGLIIEADITGISLALDAINQQVPLLELLALELTPLDKSIISPEMPSDDSFDINQIYQQFLQDFVVIKDHSQPVQPLMTPNQRANLNSNIQLAIQQAQIALVRGDQKLYQLNINNAIKWTESFFKLDEKTVQTVSQLKNQQNQIIETRYPEQLKSQKALNLVSKQQLYQWLDSSLSNGLNNKTIQGQPSTTTPFNIKDQKIDKPIKPLIEDQAPQKPATEDQASESEIKQ